MAPMSKRRQVVIVSAATCTLMILTYWRALENENVPDFHAMHEKSKFVVMPIAMDEKSYQEVAELEDSCNFKWRVKLFDEGFYESGVYDIKVLHEKKMEPKKRLPVPFNKNPIHKLDPNRFLIPALEGGPNNQVFCMRETMFLAIKMNRTLVVPKFFKHFTDSQNEGTSFVYPGHRINIDDMCGFVSCINLKQFQETCRGRIDALMKISFPDHPVGVRRMQWNMGLAIGEADGNYDNVERLPLIIDDKPYPRKDKIASTEIKEHFHTQARCLAYDKPLFNLLVDIGDRLRPAMVPLLDEPGKYDTSDVLLMEEIIRKTQAPKYVGKLAGYFIKSIVGNRPLVTAHWRYNQGDYLQRCQARMDRNHTKKSGMDKFCESALNFNAEDVAKSMAEKLTEIMEKYQEKNKGKLTVKDIYIASPPSERATVENISKILLENKGWTVHNSLELEDYFAKSYDKCGVMKKHLNDIVSTLEMEICARGIVHLSSPRSTWSANVRLSRRLCTRSGTYPELDNFIID